MENIELIGEMSDGEFLKVHTLSVLFRDVSLVLSA